MHITFIKEIFAMINITGIAHIALTVNNFKAAKKFYSQILSFLGMQKVFDGNEMLYYIGGKTAFAIKACKPEFRDDKFEQNRVGLHHLCFRALSRKDIDKLYSFLIKIKAKIITPPQEGPWAPWLLLPIV